MVWYNSIMNATLTIDKAGRVVLPKPVRDRLRIAPGDSFELETADDRITLLPVRAAAGMRKKHGIWVLNINDPVPDDLVNATLRQVREERSDKAAGPGVSSKASEGRSRK